MSFSTDVKTELINLHITKICCLNSELNALFKFRGAVNDNRLEFTCHSVAVMRRALFLIKKLYPNACTEIAVIKLKRPCQTKRYILRVMLTSSTVELRQAFYSNEFPYTDCCQAAYMRGAFLAGASINRPEKNYLWEFTSDDEGAALFLFRFMNRLDFPVRVFKRRGRFVVYLEDFESIADLLAFTGADNAVERYEIARNVKDVRILANRLVNCETCNVQRAVDAAQRQIEDIKYIIKRGVKLDEELYKTARARLKHPEMSMPELAPLLYVSTSGLKSRMKRLHELAVQARPDFSNL